MAHDERYDFDRIVPRENTNSVKWDFIPFGDESIRDELLPLWIADMDFACASPIVEAMKDRVDKRIFGYSSPYTQEYLGAVTGWFKRRAGWKIDPASIKVAPGIVPALGALIRMLTTEGDGVIVQNPVYYPFSGMIRSNGRTVVNNPLVEDNGKYRIDFADLEEKASDPGTKLILFCNPHNPVGRLWTREELSRLADICLSNDVFVIADEIHCDLVRESARYIPLATVCSDARIITCTSASKTFNLAGLATSNIVIDDEALREKWDAELLGRCGIYGANALGIVATQAAYSAGENWLAQVNDYITDNLRFVGEYLARHVPKARYTVPEGTYFAWIDFREYGYSAEELQENMLYRGKVALDEGYIFGDEGRGFERINVACPRSILRDCLERMTRAILG